jgi:tRNA modification GTPase
MEKTIGEKVKGSAASLLVRTQRHETIAKRIVERLRDAEKNSGVGEEIIAHHLKRVLNDFGEMIGETTTDDVLNSIFSRFCIGK